MVSRPIPSKTIGETKTRLAAARHRRLSPRFWLRGGGSCTQNQRSQCSIKWRWMTLKSFVINFSEFPDKFSSIVKNGTVLFFCTKQSISLSSDNSPQRTQIISENSQTAFYFGVFFSSFCFERSVDVEFKLRVLTFFHSLQHGFAILSFFKEF